MFFITWLTRGSGSDWRLAGGRSSENNPLSCPSDEELGVTSKELWVWWTVSCTTLLPDDESDCSVPCLSFPWEELSPSLLLVLVLGGTFFKILNWKGRGDAWHPFCCLTDDDSTGFHDIDVSFPGIFPTTTFELLTEVVCLNEVEECFAVETDEVFASVQRLFWALFSWCFWHIFLKVSLLFSHEESCVTEEALHGSLVLIVLLSFAVLFGSSALHFAFSASCLSSICSAETKLGLIRCFFNVDVLLWEDLESVVPLDVFSVLWGSLLALLDGFKLFLSVVLRVLNVLSLLKISLFGFERSFCWSTGFRSVVCVFDSL